MINFQRVSFVLGLVVGLGYSAVSWGRSPPPRNASFNPASLVGNYRALGCRTLKTPSNQTSHDFAAAGDELVVRQEGTELVVVLNAKAPETVRFANINGTPFNPPAENQNGQSVKVFREAFTFVTGVYQLSRTTIDVTRPDGMRYETSQAVRFADGRLDYSYEESNKKTSDDREYAEGFDCWYRKL
jgi:hypothetical protein